MSIYSGSVKKPIMTSLFFVAIMVMGLYSFRTLPIDLYPDIETNTLMVITSYNGASAADIETNITKPLENTLNTVSNLKDITSQSKENISVITLEFEFGEDIDVLTNDVRDKLDMVTALMPEDSDKPIIFKFSADMIPILMLTATAEESMPALYKILDDKVANSLARINGVGTVSVMGAPKRVVYVYADPMKLDAYNLSIETIAGIVGAENRNTPGGMFDIGSNTYSLRVEGEFTDPMQMKSIVVGSRNGSNVYLSDVATIEDRVEERYQETYTNNQQGAMVVVQKQSGANSVQISEMVRAALPGIQASLPADVKLDVMIDTSDNIINTIDTLQETVLLAFIFVGIVVLVFLGRWRATVIIMVTIPVSLIASFIYLAVTGGSLNIITLSSLTIGIGLVVDDAIVVLENITRHIERGSNPSQAAVHGTSEVSLSVMASTLTLFAVFFPLTMITGQMGVFFQPLGWMLTIMIVTSLVCAFTLTPMMAAKMMKLNPNKGKIYAPIDNFLMKMDNAYARMINWSVRRRGWIYLYVLLFVLVSFGSLFFIGSDFFPTQDNGRIGITAELPVGTRVEIARELTLKMSENWKKEFPEIEMVNITVGQAASDNTWAALQDNGSHIMDFTIRLSDPTERERGIIEICDLLRKDISRYPEIRKSEVNAGGGRNSGMGGQSIVDIEIYGENFATTDQVAAALADSLKGVEGSVDVQISRADYIPEYQVEFDREQLAMHGLNMTTAATVLRNRINGALASKFREDGDEYDIYVQFAPEYRQSIEDIENIQIFNSQGQGVRVRDLGTVVERFSPPTIERKNRQRLITVSTVVSGVSMDKVVADARAIIAKMDIPTDVSTAIGGTYEDQQESNSSFGLLGLMILLLVFIVMAAEFESLTYPFINMSTVLFALCGVLLTLSLSGTSFNVMSIIGSVMLIGIVVKNGIVMVDYINLNRERGDGIIKAVVDGGHSRLRPVLMTTIATILGMVPLAIGFGQGSEMWRPMAVAVIGGLAISTLVTLVFVPVMYCSFAGAGVKNQRKKHRKALNK
jgi:HAE1 family hydrophobic/amphiphilic exporter-1